MLTKKEKDNILLSIKRTVIPIVVGLVMASFLGKYIDDVQSFENVLASIISAVYYSLIRLVETKWPKFGVLLGARAQLIYKKVE